MAHDYSYPSHEALTDVLEKNQDALKRDREANVIKSLISSDWQKGLDFGCGLGRNLFLLAETANGSSKKILATDPDPQRLAEAKKEAEKLASKNISIECHVGSTESLAAHAKDGLFDLILCCQVLPHVSRGVAQDILNAFHSILGEKGELILCVPFHAMGDIHDDFYHLVRWEEVNGVKHTLREPISPEAFDKAVKEAPAGTLPVRAFKMPRELPPVELGDLPFSAPAPLAFGQFQNFDIVSCLIYSIHCRRQEKPAIGDLAMKLRKK